MNRHDSMSSIIDFFPTVRGTLRENYPLSEKSLFGVGGTADALFIPEDIEDLVNFLKKASDKKIPITILGAISNVLIRDGGIPGVVILLDDPFKKIYVEGNILEVGAGVNCTRLSTFAMDTELGGLEFLMGLPGTVGGALKMNAGCYGSEISELLVEFEAVTISGNIKWLTKKDMEFSYRKSAIPDDLIVTRAWFKCIQHPDYSIVKKVRSIIEKRKSSQPLNCRSCGSTFKNPTGNKAWKLIEKAGCRGMQVGGAAVSKQHCNFIINDANATANDIETLGEMVIQKVFEATGIKLEWEIIRLGRKQ